jgi:hypothetical protein
VVDVAASIRPDLYQALQRALAIIEEFGDVNRLR